MKKYTSKILAVIFIISAFFFFIGSSGFNIRKYASFIMGILLILAGIFKITDVLGMFAVISIFRHSSFKSKTEFFVLRCVAVIIGIGLIILAVIVL